MLKIACAIFSVNTDALVLIFKFKNLFTVYFNINSISRHISGSPLDASEINSILFSAKSMIFLKSI